MIIYFSGNGNSKSIAVSLNKKLGGELLALEGDIIISPESCDITSHDKEIIWICPVYSWGLPPAVAKFINKNNIVFDKESHHHLVLTCGDDAGLTAQQWRKLIEARGIKTASTTSIIMPNTYVCMKGFDVDDKSTEEEKLANAYNGVEKAYYRIKKGGCDDDVKKGKFAWIKSKIIYPWFIKFEMSPKPFHHNEKCTGCGKCSRQCPMKNIEMISGKPVWKNNCAMCLRCYHRCPTQAVQYGNRTKNKHQYKGPTDE